MSPKDSSERWTFCEQGHIHWGAKGAAGFLFRHLSPQGEPVYLLQRRSRSVDYGGTWGIPGGAIKAGEDPEMAARREMQEEIGSLPTYLVTGVEIQDCGGGWRFHIITADVACQFDAFCGKETDATGWFTRGEMHELTLHPGIHKWLSRDGEGQS